MALCQSSNKLSMKKNKIIYWVATGIITLMMLFSAFSYLTNEAMKTAFVHLGFPSYFRVELAAAKIVGALVLIIPVLKNQIKTFAYAGFAITFISAFVAHEASGDPVSVAVAPLVFLALLAVSYLFYIKTQKAA